MTSKQRIDKSISTYGESFLINGTTAAKGFFDLPDLTTLNTYFDGVQLADVERPALIVLVPADTSVAVGNTVIRDGRTYAVSRIAKRRIKDAVVLQTLLLS